MDIAEPGDMTPDELRARTQAFAVQIVRVVQPLTSAPVAGLIARQLLRSGESIGSNYRSACRAKSPADFVAKMKIVEEESDETAYWLELLAESSLSPRDAVLPLLQEARELIAIAAASVRTARARRR